MVYSAPDGNSGLMSILLLEQVREVRETMAGAANGFGVAARLTF